MGRSLVKYKGKVKLSQLLFWSTIWLFLCFGVLVSPYLLLETIIQGPLLIACSLSVSALMLWSLFVPLVSYPIYIYDSLNANPNNHKHIARADRAFGRLVTILDVLPVNKGLFMSGLLSRLAETQLARGDYDRALFYYDKGLENLERKRNSESKKYHIAVLRNNRGVALLGNDDFVEAEIEASDAFEFLEEYQIKHKTASQLLVLAPLTVLGTIRLRLGELEKAEEVYQNILQRIADNSDASKAMPTYRTDSFVACIKLAMALIKIRLEKVEEAKAYTNTMLDVFERDPGSNYPQALRNLIDLSSEFIERSDLISAERVIKMAYVIGQVCPLHRGNARTLVVYEKLMRLNERSEEDIELMKQWLA